MLEKGKIENIKNQLRGSIFVPGEDGYDESRAAWNLTVDQHPEVIVVARDAADIAAAVSFASQNGLGVAAQSTGHGIGQPADGCLLVRTSDLTGVEVDVDSRSAYVESGARWGAVLEKAQAAGLAPLLGSSPEVGVAGYTLGGGFGWLGRKYGLALDSVNYFDAVTADGQVQRVSENENADLFWAMRGGGGGFALLAGMQIRLYPVETVYAGNLFYSSKDAKQVFTRYREWIRDAPDELTSAIVLMNYPPLDMVPEIFRGKSFVIVRGCWCGDPDQGEELLSYWRDWKQPVHDFWGEIPFSQAATISNDPVDPMPSYFSGAWMSDLEDGAVDIILERTLPRGGPPVLVFTEVRHAGGAVARVDADANAYSHRDSELVLEIIGLAPTPDAFQNIESYISGMMGELNPHLTGGVYMNFLEGDRVEKRVRDAYPPDKFQRLQQIKARYDPGNMFRFGFGIDPQV